VTTLDIDALGIGSLGIKRCRAGDDMQARQRQSFSTDFAPEALLAGQTVLVAGGTGNVGRHLVRALLDHGANVVVPSRSPEPVAAPRDRLAGQGADRLITIVGDIRDEATQG
jgi:FlaA1/EpsC-like NDP-sugar epimerase